MAIKKGNRVTVLDRPGALTADGFQVSRYAGKKGEVVQVGAEGHVPCPGDGYVLVDDQVVNGQPQGVCNMREWFRPEDLEVG